MTNEHVYHAVAARATPLRGRAAFPPLWQWGARFKAATSGLPLSSGDLGVNRMVNLGRQDL